MKGNILFLGLFLATAAFGAAKRPLLVVHRGAGDLRMPEASLAAYSNAVEEAMDIVKLDLQCTRDGVIVLGHDQTLKRNMGWDVRIEDLDYKEILDKGVYTPKGGVTNARIVRLDEALEVVKSVPQFWLDFKHFTPEFAEKVLKTCAEAGIREDRLMAATFSYKALAYLRERHPNIRRVAHIGSKVTTAEKVEKYRRTYDLWGVNLPYQRMSREEVAKVVAAGNLWISLWFVQDAKSARDWADVGVDAYVTDRATDVRRGLEKMAGVRLNGELGREGVKGIEWQRQMHK